MRIGIGVSLGSPPTSGGGGGGGGGGANVLFLLTVIDPPLSADRAARKAWHEAAGHTVTLKDLDDGYDASDEDYDLLVTEADDGLIVPWRTVGVPMLSVGYYDPADLLYTSSNPLSLGDRFGITVANGDHAINAALGWSTGSARTMTTEPITVQYRSPAGAGGVSLGTTAGGVTQFAYDAGSALVGGSLASSRRVWFRWAYKFDLLAEEGLAFYASCVDWCLGNI